MGFQLHILWGTDFFSTCWILHHYWSYSSKLLYIFLKQTSEWIFFIELKQTCLFFIQKWCIYVHADVSYIDTFMLRKISDSCICKTCRVFLPYRWFSCKLCSCCLKLAASLCQNYWMWKAQLSNASFREAKMYNKFLSMVELSVEWNVYCY